MIASPIIILGVFLLIEAGFMWRQFNKSEKMQLRRMHITKLKIDVYCERMKPVWLTQYLILRDQGLRDELEYKQRFAKELKEESEQKAEAHHHMKNQIGTDPWSLKM